MEIMKSIGFEVLF